jgi:energy-coupling factor transport system substrate-specific component
VSWQLASFALVAVGLAMALAWYERCQPPARLIAVVATLAALAALGRDAFAAIPDVKPITAIVLVSGVAFGAGPGFAVGAISGFASNILLGEGPWTPWQMLGWGLVGLIGAALGSLTSRRMAPLALALACAACAEVFNLLLDLYTWTGAGEHSMTAFGVVLGSAAVFDVTHVVASFAFALVFGGVLLRMLLRVRARLEVTWEPAPRAPAGEVPGAGARWLAGPALFALVLWAALLPGVPGARAASPRYASPIPARSAPAQTGAAPAPAGKDESMLAHRTVAVAATSAPGAVSARLAIGREIAFVAAAQNSDGGFGAARGQSSTELYSAWVAMGLAAAGRDPASIRHGGHSVLDALRGEAASLQGAGDLERTILALHACGVSVRSLPGGDPVAKLLHARTADGSFADLSNITAFAIFALRAAGYPASAPVVRGAGRWLARQQNGDGGFGFGARGGPSDVDDTAAAVQAIADAGAGARTLRKAAAFLTRSQSLDGGYPQQPGGLSNAQSTSWAVQGLIAAGKDPATIRRRGGRSPVAYLVSLVAPDGSVRYSRTGSQTPVWVTAQALTALAGKPFPIAPPAAARARRASSTAASALASQLAAAARAARSASTRRPGRASAPRGAPSVAQTPLAALAVVAGALGSIARAALGQMPW